MFGNFFQKVASPSIEKKEHEVAPAVPPKDDPPMTSTIASANKRRTSQDQLAHNIAGSEGRATSAASTTPRPVGDRRRSSFFGLGNSMKKERSTAESEAGDETVRTLKPSTPSKLGDLFRRPSKTPRAHENEKREVLTSTAVPESNNATRIDNLSKTQNTGLSGITGTKDEIRAVENDNNTNGHAIGTVDAGQPQTRESGTAVHAAA